jgi:hypothetical protein
MTRVSQCPISLRSEHPIYIMHAYIHTYLFTNRKLFGSSGIRDKRSSHKIWPTGTVFHRPKAHRYDYYNSCSISLKLNSCHWVTLCAGPCTLLETKWVGRCDGNKSSLRKLMFQVLSQTSEEQPAHVSSEVSKGKTKHTVFRIILLGILKQYTGCFTTVEHNCRRWFPRSVIKKVHINMCLILDGYGVMTAFSFPYTPFCEPRLSLERRRYLDTWAVTKVCGEQRGGLGSHPSGSLCCGRRWHFRESALNTVKFKLKVISRS